METPRKPQLADARKRQLADARRKAVYSRRLKQRVSLTALLEDVNRKIADHEMEEAGKTADEPEPARADVAALKSHATPPLKLPEPESKISSRSDAKSRVTAAAVTPANEKGKCPPGCQPTSEKRYRGSSTSAPTATVDHAPPAMKTAVPATKPAELNWAARLAAPAQFEPAHRPLAIRIERQTSREMGTPARGIIHQRAVLNHVAPTTSLMQYRIFDQPR